MAHITIEAYLEANYSKWLKRTRRKLAYFGMNSDYAPDLLQYVLFVVFKKRTEEDILVMISETVHDTYSMLEIFISRTMHNRMMNFKKHCRVVDRVMFDIDIANYKVEQQSDKPADYDVYEKQRQVGTIIRHLNVDERTKYVLNEKLVCNNELQNLQGSHTTVSKTYRYGLQQLMQTTQIQQQQCM